MNTKLITGIGVGYKCTYCLITKESFHIFTVSGSDMRVSGHFQRILRCLICDLMYGGHKLNKVIILPDAD